QICKVFRQGEHGRLHNPEFTMLEWYRPGYDHHDLMDEVEALLRVVLAGLMDLPATHRCTYRELFQRYVNVDPFCDDVSLLQSRIREQGLELPLGLGDDQPDAWRDFLLTHVIEPRLPERPVFVYDFPVSQAALARVRAGDPPVAERFELYVNGVELANGYHELTNSEEQRERMERDVKVRQKEGLSCVATDQRLLSALDAGLPDCAGVAVGIDRLIMMAAGAPGIQEVISFPVDRA
ncbi:MAG: amino acid--tRNA ligase-related protein, partial [Gammaproteobacteria bacterium]